jgi:pimeloyl-ACP methyl ester carboxylesterase
MTDQVLNVGGLRPGATIQVQVPGGTLHALTWGSGDEVVLGIHGITASGMSFAPVARHLNGCRLIAPDLRGRGASRSLPGPFGMQVHARDCATLIEHASDQPVVVVGESMGAYVAVVLAAIRPDLVRRLVLVDGGLPPQLPEGIPPEKLIEALLGPAFDRLRTVYPDRESYRAQWRAHPALLGHWSTDIQAYLDYEMTPVEGGFRSSVSEDAVRADSHDNLVDPTIVVDSLAKLQCPVTLLRATRDLADREPPILPDSVVEQWRTVVPQLKDEVVPDSNHYTIFFDPDKAARIAQSAAG